MHRICWFFPAFWHLEPAYKHITKFIMRQANLISIHRMIPYMRLHAIFNFMRSGLPLHGANIPHIRMRCRKVYFLRWPCQHDYAPNRSGIAQLLAPNKNRACRIYQEAEYKYLKTQTGR
ncbi:UDP-N-acetylglucosaminyltransferase [Cordyceps militaris]|uniref:UDP-N-acetylglucosaminyltransferase n=1 Tax=Cordyceps militaris TaxID=73501 RepID=A0A2H4SUX1_CORMI|nr:UDP-N-acetylglucosaminyltransferase [Cordyceps militaris]